MIAASFAVASAPAVLVTLGATALLLALRVWCFVMGIALSRQAIYVLDGAIGALTVLFLVLVVARFFAVG